MARTPDFSTFTKEALLGILNALGVNFPGQPEMDVSELAKIVTKAEKTVGEKLFAEAIAKAQGFTVVPSASQQSTGSTPAVRGPDGAYGARSLVPGSSIKWTVLAGVGTVGSETWDPPTPLEYGRPSA